MPSDKVLKTIRYGRERFNQHEEVAVAAVDAGMLIERTTSGVQPHSTTHERVSNPGFAVERRSRGMEFGDTYAVDNIVKYVTGTGGLNALLAPGETVSHGDELVSAGNGTLQLIDQDGTSPDDVDAGVVATVDMREAAINEGESATIDNSGGSDPVPVPIEVVQ